MSKFNVGESVKHVLTGERLLVIKPLRKDNYLVQRAWMVDNKWFYEVEKAREIELKKRD